MQLVCEVVFDSFDQLPSCKEWDGIFGCVNFEHVLILAKSSDGQLVEVDFDCFLVRLASTDHLTFN